MELQHNVGMTHSDGEGGNAIQVPTHPVIGVATMYCGTCGAAMFVYRRAAIDKFLAKCHKCNVTVAVPLMLTNAPIVES